MLNYGKWLMRIAAIYMLMGALIGADMAGRSSYSMVAGHAHILVVGWLTLFAYGMFYYVFREKLSMKKTASLHFLTSMIGGGLMPIGMLLYYQMQNTATLLGFIIPASILLIAAVLFIIILFFDKKLFSNK
ncbi:hypothetical protein JCM10914A_30280 [Paenibacillus sp. JCM 10914]|uniref:hypothetical protein n=1 Tax=Paenibacillus sp. JCM 10914 TaxID=1236974 RepID=UPI0003CC4CAB|nr:hypothetical protein [Paenibacillus sp. JCM 10914]GAE07163.1 hypothetical protein JCM10914_3376 [Paenibacillus sp. JCM 10914]